MLRSAIVVGRRAFTPAHTSRDRSHPRADVALASSTASKVRHDEPRSSSAAARHRPNAHRRRPRHAPALAQQLAAVPLDAVIPPHVQPAARGQAARRHVHRPVEYGRRGRLLWRARLWRDAGEFALRLGRGVDGSAERDVAGRSPALQPRLWREQPARRHHVPGVAPRTAHRHLDRGLQSDGLDGAGAGAARTHGRDDGTATARRLPRLPLLLPGARPAGGRGAEARGAGPRAARQDDQRPPRSRARGVPRRPARRPIPSGRRGGRAAVGCGAPLWRRSDQAAGYRRAAHPLRPRQLLAAAHLHRGRDPRQLEAEPEAPAGAIAVL